MTNPKSQISSNDTNSNDRYVNPNEFGIWRLGFIWDLVLGIWSLPVCPDLSISEELRSR